MAQLDPKNRRVGEPEVSDKEAKLGVYVFQPKNAQEEPIGDKKFLASNEAAHVEAFLQVGYRAASEKETEEYRKMTGEARKESRSQLAGTNESKDSSEADDLRRKLDESEKARKDAEAKLADAKKEGNK